MDRRTFLKGDTAGAADYDRIRPLAYPGTDVFMVVFSVSAPSTMERVADRWLPELRATNPNTPVVLVASKLDLRSDPMTRNMLKSRGAAPVSPAQGDRRAT